MHTFISLQDLAHETGADVDRLIEAADKIFWRGAKHSANSRFTPPEVERIAAAVGFEPPEAPQAEAEPDEPAPATIQSTTKKEMRAMSTNTPPHPVYEPDAFREHCLVEFKTDASLQAEFKTLDRYIAYRKARGWEEGGRAAGGQ